LDWPTGRSWDHLSRWGTEPLEKEESLPPDLVAALRAEPRLDAEGQRLFVSAYEGFASPPSAPDVLAVLTADRRLDEAGRALLVALFTSLVTSSKRACHRRGHRRVGGPLTVPAGALSVRRSMDGAMMTDKRTLACLFHATVRDTASKCTEVPVL
jgi:hypothetical protein